MRVAICYYKAVYWSLLLERSRFKEWEEVKIEIDVGAGERVLNRRS